MSPIWNLSPNVREYHQEPSESSRQQENNAVLMEMLIKIEHNMKERDHQLRIE